MLRQLLALALASAVPAISHAAPLSPAPVTTAPLPTAADLSALPVISDAQLSPDGTQVAALGIVAGLPRLLVLDVGASQPNVRTFPIAEGQEIDWVRWTAAGRLLTSLSSPHDTQLLAIDSHSGATRALAPALRQAQSADVLFTDPRGDFALLSVTAGKRAFPSVWRVDLKRGDARLAVAPAKGVRSWIVDGNGVVRAGVGLRRDRSWLLYRAHEGEDFARRTEGRESPELSRLVPVKDSDQGYVISDGPAGHAALYRYDFARGRMGALVYENAEADLDDFQADSDGVLRGVFYTTDRPEVEWFDEGDRRAQARVDALLPGRVNRLMSPARGARVLVRSDAPIDPGSYYLFDSAAGTVALLAPTSPALAGKRLAPMQSVHYVARDGLGISAYLTLPEGRTARGLPLVVMPHGGPFARDSWGFDPWVQYLAARGYAVLQPNFRGSTGFGDDFVEKGGGEWGRGMQDDIDDGVKWLAAQGVVDGGRVCIMGASFGGYAAMWAAVRNPELYRCAISFAGISDVEGMLRADQPTFDTHRDYLGWRERVQGDRRFPLASVSPLAQVDRLTVPILIAHGTIDDNVPVAQSRTLDAALTRLHRDHDYVEYRTEGHGLDEPADSEDFLDRVGKFLDKHNPS